MCGIAGIWNRSGLPVEIKRIDDMTRKLAHRGPDGEATLVLGNIGLGHRRLSIVDLSKAADQPMSLPDQSLWLTYNGEIHNYLELREELQSRGAAFRTQSDTEVVLWAYKLWGTDCFERFNGMWAMAFWEPDARKLTLSRDRFGIKPLHFSVAGDRIVFASEVKAIIAAYPTEARINRRVAYEFMAGGWPQADNNTFFHNIESVPPANNLIFLENREIRQRYWQFQPGTVEPNHTAPERFSELLDDAVKLRLRSDVPVSVCLSGGLDSSAITRLMGRQRNVTTDCYSLQYGDKSIDESHFAEMVADDSSKYRIRWVRPRTDDFVGTLEKIVWHYDAPSALRAKYPKWFVMEEAGKNEKVLLGGHGADELLGGYGHFVLPYVLDSALQRHSPPLEHLRRFGQTLRQLTEVQGNLLPILQKSVRSLLKQRIAPGGWPWQKLASREMVQRFSSPNTNNTRNAWYFSKTQRPFASRFDSALWFELTRAGLPESLHAEDATSMAFGIESRQPFLDHRIVELSFSLPFHQKLHDGWTKWPLRQAGTQLLPKDVCWRRQKKGYPGAFVTWMTDSDTLPQLRDIAVSGPAVSAGLLDNNRIQAIGASLDSFATFVQRNPDRAWRLLTLQLWCQQYETGSLS